MTDADVMRAAVYHNNDDVRVEQVPVPRIGPGEILVKILASGICGSDVMEWYRTAKAPLVLGHEIAGEVAEIGSGVDGFVPGDRVAVSHHVPCDTCRFCLAGQHTLCRTLRSTNFDPGGFAQYVRVPEINVNRGVLKLPDDIAFEDATFIEPLGCVVRAHRIAEVRPDRTVFVIGSGISGLLHVKLAVAEGAAKVVASDVDDWRLAAADCFGADATIDAREGDVTGRLRQATGGGLADYVMVCTAAPAALETAISSVEDGGTVMLFAPYESGTAATFDIADLWLRQVKIVSTYAAAPEDLRMALELIGSGKIGVSDMITHRLPLDETAEGFRLVATAHDSIKVIIEPQK